MSDERTETVEAEDAAAAESMTGPGASLVGERSGTVVDLRPRLRATRLRRLGMRLNRRPAPPPWGPTPA